MPFTPSHAVAALPFVRTPLVPAAIAVGAMAPDLPLYVRGTGLLYSQTHSLPWLPVTVVVSLVLLLVWRCLIRPVARALSPRLIADRLPPQWDAPATASLRETFAVRHVARDDTASPDSRASVRGTSVLVVSLLIGVASHVLWDGFTHEGRLGPTLFPALGERWGPLTGFTWLQHGSSVLGLAILGVAGIIWLATRTRVKTARVLPRWMRAGIWTSLPVALVAGWVLGLLRYGPLTSDFGVAHLAYAVLPQASAVWAAFFLAVCVIVQVARTQRRTESVS